MKNYLLLFSLLFAGFTSYSQGIVSGKVTSSDGEALIGVNVQVSPGNKGTSTGADGSYNVSLSNGDYKITYSYLGFKSSTKNVSVKNNADVQLNVQLTDGGTQLDEMVLVGTRTAPRSNTTSALPVDVLSSKEISSTGQATFDKALQYKIPSFNTVQTPVNDATSLLDPYEIRNMGPSRTLILINGKRKNLSSLLYVQTSPGRGETGSDISAIPIDAIERVEILRDGASAQYGSDAIAGVMNIILKKRTDYGSTTIRTGVTSEGDGEMLGISLNSGSTVGDKGFVNYTVDFSKVGLANRPGTVDAAGEAADFGASLSSVQSFLALKPDAGNINGSPETAAANF